MGYGFMGVDNFVEMMQSIVVLFSSGSSLQKKQWACMNWDVTYSSSQMLSVRANPGHQGALSVISFQCPALQCNSIRYKIPFAIITNFSFIPLSAWSATFILMLIKYNQNEADYLHVSFLLQCWFAECLYLNNFKMVLTLMQKWIRISIYTLSLTEQVMNPVI